MVQIYFLLDMILAKQEELRAQDRTTVMAIIIITGYVLSGGLMGLLFYLFAHEGCDLGKFLISFTIVLTLVFSALSAYSAYGVMPSALMTLYCYWVLYGALSDDPNDICNKVSSDVAQVVIGLIITCVSVTYRAISLSSQVTESVQQENGARALLNDEEFVGKDEAEGGNANKKAEVVDLEEERAPAPVTEEEPRVLALFHLVLVGAAMHTAMVLTNWGAYDPAHSNVGEESMWIKIVGQWVCVLMYIWILLAPRLFPERFEQ